MFVGVLKLSLHIPKSNSLKHKRMILNSLKGKLRNNFNISVAEVDEHDLWQKSVIAVSFVSLEKKQIHQITDKVMDFVERFNGADLIEQEMEIL